MSSLKLDDANFLKNLEIDIDDVLSYTEISDTRGIEIPMRDFGIFYYTKKDGVYLRWYEDILLEIVSYKNNQRHGERFVYHENKILIEKSMWENGKKDGWFKLFSEKGDLIEYSNWKNGKKIGPSMQWDTNGKPKFLWWTDSLNNKNIYHYIIYDKYLKPHTNIKSDHIIRFNNEDYMIISKDGHFKKNFIN